MASTSANKNKRIKGFYKEYSFLQNVFPSTIIIEGQVYPTVEHAYQTSKTDNQIWRETVRSAQTPVQAKEIGRQIPLREDWNNNMRLEVMRGLLFFKFSQNKQLQQLLLKTEDSVLVHEEDSFWGENLGCLLMETRELLRSQLTVMLLLGADYLQED